MEMLHLLQFDIKWLPKNIGTDAVATDMSEPIIINFLKSIGKLFNTSFTSKARNIKINAELKIKPPIKPPPGLLWPAKIHKIQMLTK